MLEHALIHPTIEVCGLIGGQDMQATTIYAVKNIADDPKHRFLMDPEEQIAAMRTMRETNESLWGIYHSHLDSPAEPSQTDKEMAAYPGVYYFIISLISKIPELIAKRVLKLSLASTTTVAALTSFSKSVASSL